MESENVAPEDFSATFDEYFAKYLSTDDEQLDDHEIRSFTLKVPSSFVLSEDRYDTMFKVLFKVKNVRDRAIVNDTMLLLQRCFVNVDFNKFMLDFWSCDEFQNRELGPIGYSYSEGRARFDLNGVASHNNDMDVINGKAQELAWSFVNDVEATMNTIWQLYLAEKRTSIFCLILLRRFKCLGEYTVTVNGENVPIFLHFWQKYHREALDETSNLNATLYGFVSVAWAPIGKWCWSLLKPNDALIELMSHVKDDQNLATYLTAIHKLFVPLHNFRADIKWHTDSEDFDNPARFLFEMLKYYNRKQSIDCNNMVFGIFKALKDSLYHGRVDELVVGKEFEGRPHLDWPFVFQILNLFKVKDFVREIPPSILASMTETEAQQFLTLDESETSFEAALISIFEMGFVCGQVSDVFYKNFWKTLPHPDSFIDVTARSIIKAYNNLKNAIKISFERKFVEFLSRVCHYCFDFTAALEYGRFTEINTDLVIRSTHLVVLARTVRLFLLVEYQKTSRKPVMSNMDPVVRSLFILFDQKVREKFGDIRTANHGSWPPWRKGTSPSLEDDKSIAINHLITAFQKEAYCIFDLAFGTDDALLDLLFYLCKQRKTYATFSRVDDVLRGLYPGFFEPHSIPNGDSSDGRPNRRNGPNSSDPRRPVVQARIEDSSQRASNENGSPPQRPSNGNGSGNHRGGRGSGGQPHRAPRPATSAA